MQSPPLSPIMSLKAKFTLFSASGDFVVLYNTENSPSPSHHGNGKKDICGFVCFLLPSGGVEGETQFLLITKAGVNPSAFHLLTHLMLISQMRKPRHRQVKYVVQGHRKNE